MRNFIDAACSTHPEIRRALVEAESRTMPYADPVLWDELSEQVRLHFGNHIGCLPLRTNTLATSLALSGPGEAILAAHGSHPFTHEGAALARIANKIPLPVPTVEGLKIRATALQSFGAMDGADSYHRPRISGVVVAQPTEFGDLYSETEIRTISNICRARDWKLHIDGARFPMAAAACATGIKRLFAEGAIDSIGIGFGKAVGGRGALLLARESLTDELAYGLKSSGALDERLWEVIAAAICMLHGQRWIELGASANAAAERLRRLLGVRTEPVCANLVFVQLSAEQDSVLKKSGLRYYSSFGPRGESRFATAWDTTDDDISSLAEALLGLSRDKGVAARAALIGDA